MPLPHSSIRSLILTGFLFVVLPLVVGLIGAMLQVDRLALQMQQTVHDSAKAVEAGRLITSVALSMERSAEQYAVLHEAALLGRYATQREQLAEAIMRLRELSLDEELSAQITTLESRESALNRTLQSWENEPLGASHSLRDEDKLVEIVRPIPFSVSQLVARESESVNARISETQRFLVWQALALIPLALLLAGVFIILLSRPLKSLGGAIHRLGSGGLDQPISISGPQDIRELGEQLEWMRQRLSEIEGQKRQFLQHISHELKTPLAAIREGTELLRDGVVGMPDSDQAEVLAIIHQSSLQLQAQVESLLNFNLAMAQSRPAELEPVDLAELIPSMLAKHQLALRARDIQVYSHLQPSPVMVDRGQIETVVDNLLSNAVKYTPNGGNIRIELSRHQDRVCVDIIDSGAGISTTDRERIFEPFYQGERAPYGPLKGTGLGLSIVRRYLDMHQGSIELLQSSDGAHFRVCLPLYSPEEQ